MKLSEAISAYGDVDIKDVMGIRADDIVTKEYPPDSIKKIDMSAFIESELDCEFNDGTYEVWLISGLTGILDNYYLDDVGARWNKCRPRFNYPYANSKGWDKCPVPIGYRVRVWMVNNNCELIQQEWNGGDFEYKWSSVRIFEIIEMLEGWEL